MNRFWAGGSDSSDSDSSSDDSSASSDSSDNKKNDNQWVISDEDTGKKISPSGIFRFQILEIR